MYELLTLFYINIKSRVLRSIKMFLIKHISSKKIKTICHYIYTNFFGNCPKFKHSVADILKRRFFFFIYKGLLPN